MQTFTTWLENRQEAPLVPESDRIVKLIIMAGPGGVSLSDLISSIRLPQDVVVALVNGMVDLGMVKATGSGLARRFTYCCRLA